MPLDSNVRRPSQDIDWATFSIFLALVGIGWGMLYSVGYGDGYPESLTRFLLETEVGKQSIWVLISAVTLSLCLLIDANFWRTFALPIFGLCMLLLVLVLLLGANIKGATSWFRVGPFTFQPSELAKFGTALGLASFLAPKSIDLRNVQYQLVSLGFLIAPMVLIVLQPDPGSALVFLGFGFVLYREGFSPGVFVVIFALASLLICSLVFEPPYVIAGLIALLTGIAAVNLPRTRRPWPVVLLVFLSVGILLYFEQTFAAIGAAAAAAVVMFYLLVQRNKSQLAIVLFAIMFVGSNLAIAGNWAFNNVLKPHQRDRVNVWLAPEKSDPRGSLYNVLQSKRAIGSGGLAGKGFLEGEMTTGNYVPEQTTDFIFCTVGEEQGFIGTASVIVLFLLLMYRTTQIAERQRTVFGRAYAYGVVGILFVHFLVNIGMTMGIMPVIGIPLPFISKGGSSLIGFTLLIGVLLKIDSAR